MPCGVKGGGKVICLRAMLQGGSQARNLPFRRRKGSRHERRLGSPAPLPGTFLLLLYYSSTAFPICTIAPVSLWGLTANSLA